MSTSKIYRIDDSYIEHGCCWDSAIVIDCEPGQGMYGRTVKLVCECDKDDVDMIVKALNSVMYTTKED